MRSSFVGAVFAIALCACRSVPEPPDRGGGNQHQAVAVGQDASASDASRVPFRIDSMASALEQTFAVVEGQVVGISYSFDEKSGPRTNVVLSSARSRLGPAVAPTITLRILGGPTGDGHLLLPSELPTFATGLRYLVFLTNRDWFASPVVLDLAFRIERAGSQEVLVAQDGSTVHGFSDAGLLTGQVRVADHAGSELSNPFAAPAFTPPDSQELSKTVDSAALVAALAQYKPLGMRPTALSGSFSELPIVPPLGWRQVAVSGAAQGADGGVEGGK